MEEQISLLSNQRAYIWRVVMVEETNDAQNISVKLQYINCWTETNTPHWYNFLSIIYFEQG